MRLDRFITLNFVQPARRAAARLRPAPLAPRPSVPILMYHSISDDPEPGVPAYYKTCTRPAVFRQHMQFLADNGYRTITVDQLLAWLNNPQCPAFDPQRSVVLTFDDAYRDFYTEAFPVMAKYGFSAAVFVSTAFIGDTRRQFGASSSDHHSITSKDCMTWGEIDELLGKGIQFGSHTVNHPRLVDLPWDQVETELRESKWQLENRLGQSVKAFSYPFAYPQTQPDFVLKLKKSLATAGYDCCFTTGLGCTSCADDAFELKRVPVNTLDDGELLESKLMGNYDWLSVPQHIYKSARTFVKATNELVSCLLAKPL
jgi:peptidoglycan/xylan/chitin deacetylase (PgdA/CDA1 family)